MNIKAAAFTESEKSINTIYECVVHEFNLVHFVFKQWFYKQSIKTKNAIYCLTFRQYSNWSMSHPSLALRHLQIAWQL